MLTPLRRSTRLQYNNIRITICVFEAAFSIVICPVFTHHSRHVILDAAAVFDASTAHCGNFEVPFTLSYVFTHL